MGSIRPGRDHLRDVEFGWPLLEQIVDLGIGHAMVVRQRDVIAVEATEGLESMISRAASLCRRRGWVLLKTAPPGADGECSAVSADTIARLAAAGAACLALGAARVRFDDRRAVLAAADRAGIAVVGVAPGPRNGPCTP
jgi:hypothetical protein